MNKDTYSDELLLLVKDTIILTLTVRLDMSRHTMLKISFSRQKREQVYTEIVEMQKRLASVDTDTIKSRKLRERFIIFRANFLAFEHEVIDFVNLFHVRVFGHVTMFQRDFPKVGSLKKDLKFASF